MKCMICNTQCEEGFVEPSEYNNLLKTYFRMFWYPSSEEGKLKKIKPIPLYSSNNAYYCPSCKKAFLVMDNTENGIV